MRPRVSSAAPVALLLIGCAAVTGCPRAADEPAPTAAPDAATAVEPAAPAAAGAAAPADAAMPEGVLRAYVWECDNGLTLHMQNLLQENAIALDMYGGARKLLQVVSASGAKYSDGDFTFWTKGDTATFQRAGSPPVECRELRAQSLLADARERGVRYLGRGNEPGWTVEIGPGARLEFATNYGQKRVAFAAATESGTETAGARVFRAEHGGQRIKVSVTTQACTDDMSDEQFEQLMVVEYGGKDFRGCATALQ